MAEMWDACDRLLKKVAQFANPQTHHNYLDLSQEEKQVIEDGIIAVAGLQQLRTDNSLAVVNLYKRYFPALESILPDPEAFAKAARHLLKGNKAVDTVETAALSETISSTLPDKMDVRQKKLATMDLVQKILAARDEHTIVPETVVSSIMLFLQECDRAQGYENLLVSYLHARVGVFAPSITDYMGASAAAQLLIRCGGMRKLVSSTAASLARQHAAVLSALGSVEEVAEAVLKRSRRDAVPEAVKRKQAESGSGADTMPAPKRLRDTPPLSSATPDVEKVRNKWMPRRRLVALRNSNSPGVFARVAEGRVLRIAVSRTSYRAAVFVRWPQQAKGTANPEVCVDFGDGAVNLPLQKVSNSPLEPSEVPQALVKKALPVKEWLALPDGDDGDDWEPETFGAEAPRAPVSTKLEAQQPLQHSKTVQPTALPAIKPTPPPAVPKKSPYPHGMLVEARGLVTAKQLNGKRARVCGPAKGRTSVRFLGAPPGTEKALQAINIVPVPPEEDPIISLKLPRTREEYEMISESVLWTWVEQLNLVPPPGADHRTLTDMIVVAVAILD